MALKENPKKHIYFYLGTTAEFIKLAPTIKELKMRRVKFKLITSGQNRIRFGDLETYLGPIKVDTRLSHPTINLSAINFNRDLEPKLGLDLQGGTHMVLSADMQNILEEDRDQARQGCRRHRGGALRRLLVVVPG